MTDLKTPTIIAARWRKAICEELIRTAGYLAQGLPLIGGPVLRDVESEVTDPFAFALAIVGPDGVVVQTHGFQYKADADRAIRAIEDAFDPEEAERRLEREESREKAMHAIERDKPFACALAACRCCSARFATKKGREAHYRHARRADRDWIHDHEHAECPRRPSAPALVVLGDPS